MTLNRRSSSVIPRALFCLFCLLATKLFCCFADEILAKKTISIEQKGNATGFLSAKLEGEFDLIRMEVEGECHALSSDAHVSAIATFDGRAIMTYVIPCDAKRFRMKDQNCANETGNVDNRMLKVVVLGADSTSTWTLSRAPPVRFTGKSVKRHLQFVPRNLEEGNDKDTAHILASGRSERDWISVEVLEAFVDFETDGILQFTVTSEDDGKGLFVVSRDCQVTIDPATLENVEGARKYDTMHLTFNRFGRVTLSKISRPPSGNGLWYVHVLMDSSVNVTKNITFTLESIYSYPNGQVWFAGVVAFVIGVSAVFLYYVLVSDLPGLQQIFSGMRPKSFAVTAANWFKRGNKSFSYITAVFAITFAVGGYQVVHGNWQNMIETGNRDICFYNERCYIPSTHFDDFPFNLLSSNVPYVVHGLVIFLAFGFRESYCYNKNHFGYYDYSLAYAIAWSFLFEGIFSTIYHKCPTRMIFQFDTAFMFTISSLIVCCLVNHYSITDEDILLLHNQVAPKDLDLQFSRSRALRAPKVFFFFLAPILLFNYMGSLRDVDQLSTANEVVGSIFLVAWFLFLVAWGAFKLEVFFPSRVSSGAKLKDPRIEPLKLSTLTYFENPAVVKKETPKKKASPKPRDGVDGAAAAGDGGAAAAEEEEESACLRVSGKIFNAATVYFCVSGLFFVWLLVSIFKKKDLSQFFLGTCIGSVFVAMMSLEFTIIAESSRRMLSSGKEFKALRHSRTAKKTVKKILRVIVYYAVLGFVWISAGVFFIGMEVSNKSTSPSANRDLNDPCMFLNFYDSHDVWHFLSSLGLLLSAVRAVALSYPCRFCRMENLQSLVEKDKRLFVTKVKAAMMRLNALDALRGSVNEGAAETPTETVA